MQPVDPRVIELLNDPARRRAMSSEARDYAGTWSAGAMAKRMAELYRDIATRDLKAAA